MRYWHLYIILIILNLNYAYAQDNCFNIKEIKLVGASSLVKKKGHKIIRQYEGLCLSGKDIALLIRKLSNHYTQIGYITTRIQVKPQNLTQGSLILYVREGTIEEVMMLDSAQKLTPFLPLKKQKILSLRDIEQAYDHYGRLKSNNVNIDIKPGSKKNTSKIIIDNKKEKIWHIRSGIDNSGSKQKGKTIASNSFAIDNVFGFNESYNISLKKSLADPGERGSDTKSASFSIPFDYNEASFNYNIHKDYDKLYEKGVMYLNRGYSEIYNAGLNRIIHRNGKSKTIGTINCGKEIYENYLDQIKTNISSYKINKFNVGISHQNSIGSNIVSLGFNYTFGTNRAFYNKFEDKAVPDKQFEKVNFDASIIHFLPLYVNSRASQFRVNVFGQYSKDMLVASEKFSLGGKNTVRGFQDYSESGENGIVMRNEFVTYPKFIPMQDSAIGSHLFGDFSVFAAFDMGAVRCQQEQGKTRNFMSGFAAGVRNSEGLLDMEFVVAKPLKAPGKFKNRAVFYFNVGVNL